MDVLEAIRTRRSVGKLGGYVPPAVITELIEAATWAPNHRMTEPWRFTVVTGAARERLGKLWGPIGAESAKLFEGQTREELAAREAVKPTRAPVLIFVSSRTDDDEETAIEDHAATAAAIQNLLLAAWAHGLGAMWRTGGMAYDARVKTWLGLDPSDAILGIIYLGELGMEPPKARPREVESRITWLTDELVATQT